MKQKVKPVEKSDIRERVEKKFRAKGAVAFHLLVMLGAGVLLLYNLTFLWVSRFGHDGFQNSVLLFFLLGTTGALHVIRFHFKHGRGRERHESETEARIERQLSLAAPDEAEEQDELIRLQMTDKLKNRRLVFQHIALYVGLVSLAMILHWGNARPLYISYWVYWRGLVEIVGLWGIGLAAHLLRYYFAYGFSAERREAKIDAQVARELRRVEGRRQRSASRIEDKRADHLAIEDIEEAQARAR